MSLFKKAVRTSKRLRMALCGPAGSGKTFTALRIASGLLREGERLALIDTEHGSANLYADEANPDGATFDFDAVDLATMPGGDGPYAVEKYMTAIRAAADAGYPVLVIDSLSHAWAGEGGILDLVDKVTAAKKSRNKFVNGWREATPKHNQLVAAILSYPGHVIVTMRVKTAYEMDENNAPKKVGLAPIQREGLDYEFDFVADVVQGGRAMAIGKTRCAALEGKTFRRPGADVAKVLRDWLGGAQDVPPGAITQPQPQGPQEGEHHASWEAHKVPFCSTLWRVYRVRYNDVRDACVAKGWGKPSQWPLEKRLGLLGAFEDGTAWKRIGLEPPEPEEPEYDADALAGAFTGEQPEA